MIFHPYRSLQIAFGAILFLTFKTSSAQESSIWFEQGATWHFGYQEGMQARTAGYEKLVVSEDTVINSTGYRIIHRTRVYSDSSLQELDNLYVRHDMKNDRIYQYCDSTEYILYDFGAEKGDTISIRTKGIGDHISYCRLVVDSIRVELFSDSIQRRVQYCQQIDNFRFYFSGRIIEGVGSEVFLFPVDQLACDAGCADDLRCFQDSKISITHPYLGCEDRIFYQKYSKLLDPNRTWKIMEWVCGYDPCDSWENYYSISRDTLINNALYQEISEVFLREDTLDQKVFQWNGEQEEMLYDFKLQKGDTVNWLGHSWDPLLVDTVYEMSIENTTRKCIAFKENAGFNEVWIEGIGSNYGVIFPGFYLTLIDAGSELRCVFDGVRPIYGDCFPMNIHPPSSALESNPEVIFLPDQNALSITGLKGSVFVLQIFGINGSLKDVIRSKSGEHNVIVNLKDYGRGIHIYRISCEGKFSQGKFLILK
jgi:hypothetical protein